MKLTTRTWMRTDPRRCRGGRPAARTPTRTGWPYTAGPPSTPPSWPPPRAAAAAGSRSGAPTASSPPAPSSWPGCLPAPGPAPLSTPFSCRSTPNISATAAGRSPPGWGGRPPGWLPLWLWGWAASCPSQPPSPSAEPGEGLGARRGVAQPPVSQCLNWAESKPRGFNGGGEGRRGISQPSPDRIKEKYTSKQNRGLLTPDGAAKGAEASPRPGRPGCPAGCGRMAPCAPTGSGRLSRGLLLLWALLGRGLCHTAGKADGFGQEARTSPPMAKENSTEEVYGAMAERCWEFFVELMRNVTVPQLCDWKVISRPYSLLQECLEGSAEHLNHGYPNALAERFIFQSHHRYFHNCSVGNQVFDPPEDVLLAMVFAPICLIPFLVTVVIWRSKDGKAQP
ncbi:receptor activity-modifying protein 2 isoform X3 [Anas platyrhynchos]|uniref:receptor activity-modifying protein 2 isoform X3 n=1 Tax=Anas platyrhynchos TaxID=8839 RepID=UPI0018D9305D|nr:receptor activity-modifying protein 2 isoform X4 [Anas platyrhynchos]